MLVKKVLNFNVFLIILLFIFKENVAFAGIPYYSYIYNEDRRPVPSLAAYTYEKSITGSSAGLNKEFYMPKDLCIDSLGNIYVADSGNNRIVVINQEGRVIKVIDSFIRDGTRKDSFNNPSGIFVTEEGDIYIADTNNSRIVVLNSNGSLKKIIGKPVSEIIKKEFVYKPIKLAVDKLGRVYVVAENVVEGLLQFDKDGNFERFFGSNRVEVNPVELIWRKITNKKQRKQLMLFIPVEYRNVTVDKYGFLYGCIRADHDQIKRLNALGNNVIKQQGRTKNIYGDLYFGYTVKGEIVDIAVDDANNVYAVDGRVGRIFVYNVLGDLLFVIGDIGNQKGQFLYPNAIDVYKSRIYVLDENKSKITVFRPTEFGELVLKANQYYVKGLYAEAAKLWEKALKLNANYDLAYIGIANNYLHNERYKEAMKNFRLGFYPEGYSRAMRGYRTEFLRDNFVTIMNIVVGFIVATWILLLVLRKKGISIRKSLSNFIHKNETMETIFFAFHVMIHPFEGFYELKVMKKKAFKASLIILTLLVLTFLIRRLFTSFTFNPYKPETLNLLLEVGRVLLPLIAWVIINWAITTIMEGKATMKQIWVTTIYALFPLVLFYIPQVILSHIFTLNEAGFYYIIGNIGVIWSLFLLIAGSISIQDYTLSKTLGTSLLTVVGLLFISFIGMVFFNTIQQFIRFVYTCYLEIKYMIQ